MIAYMHMQFADRLSGNEFCYVRVWARCKYFTKEINGVKYVFGMSHKFIIIISLSRLAKASKDFVINSEVLH